MLELLKTNDITQENMLEAVKRINEVIFTDHKSIQTLQHELAERDEKLLNEITGVKIELQGTNKHLESLESSQGKMVDRLGSLESSQGKMVDRLESLETGQGKMIDLLRMIADNTKSKT